MKLPIPSSYINHLSRKSSITGTLLIQVWYVVSSLQVWSLPEDGHTHKYSLIWSSKKEMTIECTTVFSLDSESPLLWGIQLTDSKAWFPTVCPKRKLNLWNTISQVNWSTQPSGNISLRPMINPEPHEKMIRFRSISYYNHEFKLKSTPLSPITLQ